MWGGKERDQDDLGFCLEQWGKRRYHFLTWQRQRVRVIIAMLKHHEQSNLGGKACPSSSLSSIEGSEDRTPAGKEPGGRS